MDRAADYRGCSIPAELYDIALGWDPAPEIERLLFLAREHGLAVRSALELGCGTGRLLAELRRRGIDAAGIELSAALAEHAAARSGGAVESGDMTRFDLGREFDVVYASANTFRYVVTDEGIAGLWRCGARHLAPGGTLQLDLELGVAEQALRVGRPAIWSGSRGARSVRAAWMDTSVADPRTRRHGLEWSFEVDDADGRTRYVDSFELRAWDSAELIESARASAALACAGVYEVRDPYLLPLDGAKASGRCLCVFRASA